MTTPRNEPRKVRRILLTLDGSPFAESALHAAVTLASKMGAELRLLSALEIPPLFVYPEFRSDDRVAAEAYLARIAAGIEGIAVTTSVREGRVGDEILRGAADWNADVMVMATHGRGGPTRLWMGSTADRCVRESRRPVLVVRPRESGGVDPATALSVSRVVLPLDGSEGAETAIPYGIAMARALGVPLALLRVVTYLDAPEAPWAPGFNAGLNRDLLALETENASGYLAPLAEEARGHGLTVTTSTPRYLQSGPGILSEAGHDLVVIATRGLGGMRRGLLGSTADKVVRGAEGPVLVVPPETSADD